MTDKTDSTPHILDPVKKEVFNKLLNVQKLLIEVQSINIDGDVLYDSSKVIANIVANPNKAPEYVDMVEHLLQKNEELMQYVIDRGVK